MRQWRVRQGGLGVLQGKWTILLFYPLDFTFVCPTEIIAYDGAADRFAKLGAQVFGVSVDSHFAIAST